MPLCTDRMTGLKERISYVRVLVELNIVKDLTTEIPIKLLGGRVRTQNVLYENLPKFCTSCRIMGHSLEGCRKNNPKVQMKGNKAKEAPNQAPMVHKDATMVSKVAPQKNEQATVQNTNSATAVEPGITKLSLGQKVIGPKGTPTEKGETSSSKGKVSSENSRQVVLHNAFQSLANLNGCDKDGRNDKAPLSPTKKKMEEMGKGTGPKKRITPTPMPIDETNKKGPATKKGRM